jgi:hypothetical protein
MEYLWAIFVVTALEGGDYKYTHIETYDSRMKCEIEASVYAAYHEPWADNETVVCIKVDE